MKKKNIIVSVVIALFLIAGWTYFTLANDDRICYKYSSSNSCSIDKSNCTDWVDSKRTCYGTKTTTYTRWNSYRCWENSSETRKSYSVNWTCAEVFRDNSAPTVPEWWVK
jgi:hypothetical protein